MENIIFFDNEFKSNLRKRAKESTRLRAHHNIHNDYTDPVQRLAIGLCPGTYIPPHKHVLENQWEFFHLVEGCIKFITFSEDGFITDTHIIDTESTFAIQIPPNIIHTLVCVSDYALVFEWKQGPFIISQAKVQPAWVISEENEHSADIIKLFENCKVGDRFY